MRGARGAEPTGGAWPSRSGLPWGSLRQRAWRRASPRSGTPGGAWPAGSGLPRSGTPGGAWPAGSGLPRSGTPGGAWPAASDIPWAACGSAPGGEPARGAEPSRSGTLAAAALVGVWPLAERGPRGSGPRGSGMPRRAGPSRGPAFAERMDSPIRFPTAGLCALHHGCSQPSNSCCALGAHRHWLRLSCVRRRLLQPRRRERDDRRTANTRTSGCVGHSGPTQTSG